MSIQWGKQKQWNANLATFGSGPQVGLHAWSLWNLKVSRLTETGRDWSWQLLKMSQLTSVDQFWKRATCLMLANFKFCLPVRNANRESIVSVVTRLLTGRSNFRCPPGARDYFFLRTSRPARPAFYLMGTENIALRRELDHSPPSSRSQEWVQTCLCSLLCLHGVHRAPIPFWTVWN